jgi:hypothetical protein
MRKRHKWNFLIAFSSRDINKKHTIYFSLNHSTLAIIRKTKHSYHAENVAINRIFNHRYVNIFHGISDSVHI